MDTQKMIEQYASSHDNPPKQFKDLDTAFRFRKWKRENYPQLNHEEAVKLFCNAFNETYK